MSYLVKPYAFKKLFDEQLSFTLPDGVQTEGPILVGNTPFEPQILNDYPAAYDDEYNLWLNDVWKPQQRDVRQSILAHGNNDDRYFDLRSAVGQEYVMPIVGSGMSVPSGLPTWSKFLLDVTDAIGVDTSTLRDLIEASRFEEAANFLADTSHFRLFNERIEHDLRVTKSATIGGPILLLPQLFKKSVVTTNFDDVLQVLYKISGESFDRVLTGQKLDEFHELKNSKETMLIKLHGDCRSEADRVLLSHEYEAAYGSGGVAGGLLSSIFRNQNILFLGCSLTVDRTMDLMKGIAHAHRDLPKHFAFLPLPELANQKQDRENWLADRGIFAVWYNTNEFSHDEAISALLDGLLDE